MKIRLLFIKNSFQYTIQKDIDELVAWLVRIGLTPEYEIKNCNLSLSFKDFGIQTYWGLDGIKQQMREEGIVQPLKWDIVYFCYDAPKDNAHNLANWTYPSDLNSSVFCEIVYRPDLVGLNGKVLIHETLHAFNRLLDFKGVRIIDTLDIDNNSDRIIGLYKPLFPQMVKPYSLFKQIGFVSELLAFFKNLLKKKQRLDIERMIRRTANEAGIDEEDYETGLAVLKCESGLNPLAICHNKDGTVDRGIAQFNSYWYKQITDEQAYDPEKALPLFWKYFTKRPNDWLCYKSGAYKKFL